MEPISCSTAKSVIRSNTPGSRWGFAVEPSIPRCRWGFGGGACTHAHLVAHSCLTLRYPMNHSPPGSSVRGISQARILEWVAISSSRGSSQFRDQTRFFCSPALQVNSSLLSHKGSPETFKNNIYVNKLTRNFYVILISYHSYPFREPGLE